MRWRRFALWIGVAVVALFVFQRLVAPGDEREIEDAIEEAATSPDPSFCTELVTPAYLEQSYGLPADEAVSSCEQYAGEELFQADSVDVGAIEVDGDQATAEATYAGTTLDGSTIRLSLVRDQGEWKLDEVLDVVRFDRASFLDAYRDQLVDPLYALPPASADCVVAALNRQAEAELEKFVIEGDRARTGRILVACDRRATEELLLAPLDDSPAYPASLTDCVAKVVRAASEDRLLELFADATAYDEVAIDCDRDAYLENYYLLLVGEPYDYEPEQALCVQSELDKLSDLELARISGDRSRIEQLVDECEDAELPPSPFPE